MPRYLQFFMLAGVIISLSTSSPFLSETQAATMSTAKSSCPALLQHQVKDIDGKTRSLCDYQNKVIVVVNTASFCGFTPQYKQLETLYRRYQKQGLVILGFPANQFGKQEPGSNQEIKNFCKDNYQVSFPLMAKIEVLGKQAHPFFKQLAAATGEVPLWNFHKYVIDRKGQKVLSFSSSVKPDGADFDKKIKALL